MQSLGLKSLRNTEGESSSSSPQREKERERRRTTTILSHLGIVRPTLEQ